MNGSLNQIRNRINELMSQKEQVIVAIDGNCTAGKTTLASKLAEIYDCDVFHMLFDANSCIKYEQIDGCRSA